jgi:sortase A
MISLGAFTLYFLVYQLVGTNHVTGQAQAELRGELNQEIAAAGGAPKAGAAKPRKPKAEKPAAEGKAFAFISIPKIKAEHVIVEGTSRDDLRKGPGRIVQSKMPGAAGTFAVSGHRTTYGGPFGDLDKLKAGDEIIIRTKLATYTYSVTHSRVVLPTEVSVLDDVRGEDGKLRPTIVLTTCHPKYSAKERLIIFGDLVSTKPAASPAAA